MEDNKNVLHPTVMTYKDVSVSGTLADEHVTIGDFSKVSDSKLSQAVRIDRNNGIYSSIIGRYSYTGKNTIILHAEIGAFCSISWNVTIGGADHDYSRVCQHSFLYDPRSKLRPEKFGVEYDRFSSELIIGNDVWIAAGAVIKRGVTIGDGAIIGANSVVTADVPPYAIVVGTPARVIKYRFSNEIIQALLGLKWWLWSNEKINENYAIISSQPNLKQLMELKDLEG
jgi:acetyltransferase-like isoleucine patch superfamily enzyme